LRHAIGVRRTFDDQRIRSVQHQVDERRRIVVEDNGIAGERRYVWGETLGI
jgi:hypothetical protein